MTKKKDDKVLVSALSILVRDIQSGDAVANACIAEAADRLEELTQPQPIETPDPGQLLAEVEAKRGQLLGVPDWTHKRLLAAEEVCKAITRGESDTNDFAAFWAWHKLWKGQE